MSLATWKDFTSLETEMMDQSVKVGKPRALKWGRGDTGNSCETASIFSVPMGELWIGLSGECVRESTQDKRSARQVVKA